MTRLPAAVLAVLFLAGCASSAGGTRRDPGPPPPGQVVFQVTTDGGYEGYATALARRPALSVYADGRVLRAATSRTSTGAPAGLTTGTVAPGTLRRLVDEARRSGLFDGADLGVPQVTDLATTAVTFRPGTGPSRRVAAYALELTAADGRLTTAQRVHRAQLRRLIDELGRAVRTGTEYRPARVDVTEPAVRGVRRDGARPWPGPRPDGLLTRTRAGGRCGVLTGDTATRVYRAARGAPGIAWTVGGGVRPLVVRPLLPGERGCSG